MTVRCARPSSVRDACRALEDGGWGAKLLAGGTALMLMMQEGLVAPDLLVSMDRATDPGLRTITVEGEHVRVGALVTLADVATSALVTAHARALADACRSVGNVRIRNVATLGGNIAEADYASDPPAVLVALDAAVVIEGPDGTREAPVAEVITGFYTTTLAPSEIITAVRVPVLPSGATAGYTKFRSRASEDRPCVGIAARITQEGRTIQDLAVVLGAISASPFRVPGLAEVARGTTLGDQVIQEIAERVMAAVDPMEDHRGSAWYRRQVSGVLAARTLRGLRDGTVEEVA